ncbi:FAD-dependent oxidoreductase [Sulfitobacter sp. Ks41]|uniref:FAD/NAD(P)-dependent oxidoreductase n=1 Tax=unclassified Sulfitobacter TaxID=196795 RepID=UPI0023E144F6|nr:NAD(P)/FAD-dependent oxidoreductase [Sulfitobacter sp. Ks41]MDF3363124.1 FAD-dependent oxidoreductase [Sulfitobacter sp. Ks41]
MTDVDLIVIGAGPAGMSAAAVAARSGLRVLMLDEQPQAGGQIYRHVAQNQGRRSWLGTAYAQGAGLVEALEHPNIKLLSGATVWKVDKGPRVTWSRGGASQTSSAAHVLLATGAQERPVPFPGWTLPGVMPAGAAQILMKTAGMLPQNAVLAGSGPLLYLVAAQMIDAGCAPQALVETQTTRGLLGAMRHLPRAMFGAATLLKGLGLIAKIRRAGVPRYTAASDFRATAERSGDIRFSFRAAGEAQSLICGLLLTHQGVVPGTHITRAAGISHSWNKDQGAYQPECDRWGATNQPGLHTAGDGAGIGGAEAAAAAGELTALNILRQLGKCDADARDQRAASPRAALFRARAIRPFLDAAYAPPAEILAPADDTIVCRCEEVSAGAVRQAIGEGPHGHRQIKTSLRCGMGPCQGRMCDATLRGLLSVEAKGNHPITPPRARSPIKPIALGEMAALSPIKEDPA